ncbi:MAG TPA: T9SS type A sorting domain-containing protein, partial [Ginsengibacter sp.]|nr:T9SS type A sorting domain-containing protein [Ginsengibacter sp.]
AGLAEVKTGATADYLFTTIAPKSGINYYRVKAVMKDGSIMYSHVLAASVHLGAAGMYISPNPVREVIRLHLYRMAKGDYQIQVYTMEGKRVLSRKITHAGGSADFNITPQGMAKGLYQLEIYKPDGSKASQLLMLDK